MSIDLAAVYTATAPAGVDGYGEIAVVNDSTSANFVGYLLDLSFARVVRTSVDDVVEGDGGVFGNFYSGPLPFTMEIMVARASSWAASNARDEKLKAAFNAHKADGTLVWTESGRAATRILYRQQESPRGPTTEGKVLVSCIAASPLILANTVSGPSAPGSGLSNAGKAATFPSFSFISGASGTVVISRTSPSPTETLTLDIGGSNGIAASTATTVDFAARTVLQGSTYFPNAIQWPSSVWWAMPPGNSTISVTGASSATVSWRSAWLP